MKKFLLLLLLCLALPSAGLGQPISTIFDGSGRLQRALDRIATPITSAAPTVDCRKPLTILTLTTSSTSPTLVNYNAGATTWRTSWLVVVGDGTRTVNWTANNPTLTGTGITVTTPASGVTVFVIDWTTSQITLSQENSGVSPSSAATFTNKDFDATGTGNTLRFLHYIHLTHPHLADGTGATLGTTSTALDYGRATFSNSAAASANYAEFYFMVPPDLDTSVDPRVKLLFKLNGADTATHRYVLSMASIANSSPITTAVGTAINVDFSADASGANNDVESAGWTTLTGWGAALTAERLWVVRVARDGSAAQDASTVNSTLLDVVIEVKAAQ